MKLLVSRDGPIALDGSGLTLDVELVAIAVEELGALGRDGGQSCQCLAGKQAECEK